jgi:2-methylcitrate dehydratase
MPLLEAKFRKNLARRFAEARQRSILDVSLDAARLETMPVNDYVDLYGV